MAAATPSAEPDKHACCVTGFLHEGTATGCVEKLGALDCYVARPPTGTPANGKALIFLTDIFGFALINARLSADAYAAKAGVTVFLLDLHNGESPKPDSLDFLLQPATGMMDRVGKVFKAISPSGVPAMVYFLSRHGDGVTLPLLASAVASVKAAGFARVASIGFCWGGRYSALLGAGLVPDTSVDACIMAHPNTIAAKEVSQMAKPSLFLCAEKDVTFGPRERAAAEAALAARPSSAPSTKFVVYPGTDHGFATRGDPTNAIVAAAAEAAHAEAVAFIKATL